MVIALTTDIDGEMAAEMNQFRSKLEATLILHVGLGKEHFVPVSATYGVSLRPAPFLGLGACTRWGFTRSSVSWLEPTCFANTLSYLTRLKSPIREVKSADDLLSEEEAKNAPREVMRLVNHMMSGDGDVVRGARIIRNLVSASPLGLTPNVLFVGSLACSPHAET